MAGHAFPQICGCLSCTAGITQLREEAARAQQQFGQFDGAKDAAARAAQDARAREAQVAQMSQCVPTTLCAFF